MLVKSRVWTLLGQISNCLVELKCTLHSLPSFLLIQTFPSVYSRFPELQGRIFCLELLPSSLNLNSMASFGKEQPQSPQH